jgi:hypothetical protein
MLLAANMTKKKRRVVSCSIRYTPFQKRPKDLKCGKKPREAASYTRSTESRGYDVDTGRTVEQNVEISVFRSFSG